MCLNATVRMCKHTARLATKE